jgi:MFS family permease
MAGTTKDLIRENGALRAVLASRLVSTAGTWLAYIALVADIYARTHSSRWVAALLVMEFLPSLGVAAVSGLIDRLPRKLLLIGAELTGCSVFAALPFVGSPAGIVALAAVAGVAGAVFQPALMAAIPNLVDEADLAMANGLCQTMSTTGLAAGPALAAALVAGLGVDAAYVFDALSFAFSAAVLVGIPRRALQTDAALDGAAPRGVLEAVRLVRSTELLRMLLWTSTVAVLAVSAINVGEIFLAQATFDAGTFGFGLLASGAGAGLVAGSVVSARMVARLGGAGAYRAGLCLAAAGIAAAALSPDIWVAAVCAAGAGAGNGLLLAGRANAVQMSVSDALRGRTFALIYAAGDVATSGGMVLAGLTIGALGPRSVWLAAAVLVAVSGAGARTRRGQAVPVPACQ